MRALGVALVFAGCSFPTKPGPPLGCIGDKPPSTAPDMIQIRGRVRPAFADQPLPGAAVTGFVIGANNGVPIFTAVTDSTGSFMASVSTGGSPHSAYILSHLAPDYLDTYTYPALPVANDIIVDVQQFSQMQIDNAVSSGSLPAITPGTAMMAVSIVDCNADPITGATLTVVPSSPSNFRVTYFRGGMLDPDPNLHMTDMTGTALVTGLAPGNVTVDATMGTIPFQEHVVKVTAGAMTLTEVSP